MKRATLLLLAVAPGLGLLGAVRTSPARTTEPLPVRRDAVFAGNVARTIASVTAVATPVKDDRGEVLRRLKHGAPGTYIGEILLERDSSLVRWADRHGVPLTVWVQPQSNIGDFSSAFVLEVRNAFEAWDSLHLPVRFAFVDDSTEAKIHVTWIDHFSQPISGRTRWARDDDWSITDANITLAVHHNSGDLLDDEAVRAMALHEIGHLLGLDHTTDSSSVMAPRVRVRQLSDADRATVRLIYTLPAGPVRPVR
jgi:predicted Zn-dependent protease